MKKTITIFFATAMLLPTMVCAQSTPEEKAASKALAETAHFSKRFGIAIDTSHELYKTIYQKNLKEEQAFLHQNQTGLSQAAALSAILADYEKQTNKILKELREESFINNQIKTLDSIKPLPHTTKQQLAGLFIENIKTGQGTYIWGLKKAMNQVTDDTVYYAALFKNIIEKTARAKTSDILSKKNLSAENNKDAYNLLFARERELSLARQAFATNEKKLKEVTGKIYSKYKPVVDSVFIKKGVQPSSALALSEQEKQEIRAKRFINSQIKALDSIKSLSGATKQQLSGLFMENIKTGQNTYFWGLKKAMNQITDDTVYYASLFKKDIEKAARARTLDILSKKNLSEENDKEVYNLVFARERKISLTRQAFAADEKKLKETSSKIYDTYRFAIDSIFIKKGAQLPYNRYIGLAIAKKEKLKITHEQVNALQDVCIDMNKQRQASKLQTASDSRNYECTKILEILTEEQFKNVLTLAFNEKALKMADEKWQLIQKEGIDKGLDANSTKKQLFTFYLNRMITQERYAHDRQLQTAQLRSIDAGKPKILSKLYAIQRSSSLKDNVKSTMIW